MWDPATSRYAVKDGDKLLSYSPLQDQAVLSRMMAQRGYYWGPPPRRRRVARGISVLGVMLGLFFLAVLVVGVLIVIVVVKRRVAALPNPGQQRGAEAVLPPPGPRQHEPDHPDHWLQVEVGDHLTVNDMQAWTDMLKAANASTFGMDFTVRSALRMRDPMRRWQAAVYGIEQLSAQPGDQRLWLMAWRAADDVQLSVYYAPRELQLGTRADMLDQGQTWLFQEPSGEDWLPNELQFQPEVAHVGTNEDGVEVEQQFTMGAWRPVMGQATAYPGPRSVRQVCLARWRCEDAPHNPLMVVIEFGAQERLEGGTLQVLLGAEVRPDEVDVTPMGTSS